MADALQEETADVLARLIQFNTVNPPGDERACQEWLRDYLREAGLEVELDGAEPERPNLVATLAGEEPGPVLGYLSHVDTVLADPDDWTHDPWSGEIHDGFLWGRGALDMKSQTAAEAVAAARAGPRRLAPGAGRAEGLLRRRRGDGRDQGRQVAVREAPRSRARRLAAQRGRRDGDAVRRPPAARGLLRGEGHVPLRRPRPRRRRARLGARDGDNALLKLAPADRAARERKPPFDVADEPRAFLRAIGEDPDDPQGALARIAGTDPRLAALFEPTLGVTVAPTRISAGEKINVIPARAELLVDCRVPPGMGGEATMARVRELLGGHDGLEVEFIEQVVGNRSAIETPLMDEIRELGRGAATAAREAVPVDAARVHRLAPLARRLPRLRRLRLLPPAPPDPLRDLAADPLRRRAHRRARPRLRRRFLPRAPQEAAA